MTEIPIPAQQPDPDIEGWREVAEVMHEWHPALQNIAQNHLEKRGIDISTEHHHAHIDIARASTPDIDTTSSEEQDLIGEVIEIGQEALLASDAPSSQTSFDNHETVDTVPGNETPENDEHSQQKFIETQARLERTKQFKTDRLARMRDDVVPRRMQSYEDHYGRPAPAEWVASLTAAPERGLHNAERKLAFLRPGSEADAAYRKKVLSELPARIQESAPADVPLRFHGTPIYTAQEILASGEISSSVDRLGIETSYDTSDQVSVTTPESIKATLDSYSGITEENFFIPAGCVFVLMPTSKEEADAGSSFLMGNVNFREHPEQLFAVMTSVENVDRVRQWAQEAGVDSSKITDFFDFADSLGELKRSIEQGVARAQDYVPYPL